MDQPTAIRYFMRLFVVSVAVNTVLGIWALLASDFGDTEGRILATSFLVSAAMLSVLVNAPATRRRALWPAPVFGAGTGVSGFVLLMVMLWTDQEGEPWIKTAVSLLVVAAGATLAANLAIVALPSRYRPALPVAALLIAALVITIVTAMWAEVSDDWVARVIGVESVLVAAATLLIPALSRFAVSDDGAGVAGSHPRPGVRFCPSCGGPLDERPIGATSTCERCHLVFEVELVSGTDRPES